LSDRARALQRLFGSNVRWRSRILWSGFWHRRWNLLRIARTSFVLQHPNAQGAVVWQFGDEVGVERPAVGAGFQHEPDGLRSDAAKRFKDPLHRRLVRLARVTTKNMHQHAFASDFVIGEKCFHRTGSERVQKFVFFSEFHSGR